MRLVVALALAGEVVAGVLDRAVGRAQVVEEDEVLVVDDLAVVAAQQRAGVEVEVGAGGGADVPAEADGHGGQAGRHLGQGDVAALGEGDRHYSSVDSRKGPRTARFLGHGADDYLFGSVTLLQAAEHRSRFRSTPRLELARFRSRATIAPCSCPRRQSAILPELATETRPGAPAAA